MTDRCRHGNLPPCAPCALGWLQYGSEVADRVMKPMGLLFESPPCVGHSIPLNPTTTADQARRMGQRDYRIKPEWKLDGYEIDEEALRDPRLTEQLNDLLRRNRERYEQAFNATFSTMWERPLTEEELREMQGFGRTCEHGRVGPCVECYGDERVRRDRIGGHRWNAVTHYCIDCGSARNAVANGLVPECGVEIIVDPDDRRGYDAKPMGARA